MNIMDKGGKVRYESESDEDDQEPEDSMAKKKPRREKRRARHAVYRAIPGYSLMFVPPANGGILPYQMPMIQGGVIPPQMVQALPVNQPNYVPVQQTVNEPQPQALNDYLVNVLTHIRDRPNGMPELQTFDVSVPPKRCFLFDRTRQ